MPAREADHRKDHADEHENREHRGAPFVRAFRLFRGAVSRLGEDRGADQRQGSGSGGVCSRRLSNSRACAAAISASGQ